jgi:Flp pilus assembly protein TadG
MFRRLFRYLASDRRHQGGVAAVEFGLLLLPLILLIGAVVDFGDAYYMKQVISNASREGARYGVQYVVDPATGLPVPPSASAISSYVTSKYQSILSSDANLQVPTPTVAGNTLTVTVSADKHWFFFGGLLGLPNPQTLTATTAMNVEH